VYYHVFNADCLDTMARMPAQSVDFVLTDPPYSVSYKDRLGRSIANDDSQDWITPAIVNLERVMKPNTLAVMFYGWPQVEAIGKAAQRAGLRAVGSFCLSKRYSSGAFYTSRHHESAILFAKGKPPRPANPPRSVLPFPYTGNGYHPTQKPVEPLREMVRAYCPVGGVVFDPFAGSGSSLVAALLETRLALGCELNPEYAETAQKRCAELFEE
jgi:adenine-specific DNA-methyltransferase